MAETKEPRPGVVKSAGQPEKGTPPFKGLQQSESSDTTVVDKNAVSRETANPESKTDTTGDDNKKTDTPAPKETPKPIEIDDEAIKAHFAKLGIEYTGADDLKKKLSKIPEPEQSDEEKKKAAAAKEKRLLDLHIKKGGTPESFVNLQKQSQADPAELGKIKLEADLKIEGFPAEQIPGLIKKMHLDIPDEDLADLTPEQQDLIKKERAFGLKKLNARGSVYKKMALDYMSDLSNMAAAEDTDKERKKQFASNVEAFFKDLPRNISYNIGKVNDVEVSPYDVEIPETAIKEAKEVALELESKILNKDGSPNLDFLLKLVTESIFSKNIAKTSFLTAQHRDAEFIEKQYGKKPTLGGAPESGGGQKGKLASAGQPQYGKPSFAK